MTATIFSISFFILVTVYWISISSADPMNVTIDAAYTASSLLYLIADGKLMYVDRISKKERFQFPIYSPEKLVNFDVQAAFRTFDLSYLEVMFYGSQNGLDVQFSGGDEVKELKYGKRQKFLQNGGPDAAAKKGDEVYFFKGCKMTVRKSRKEWSKPKRMNKIGLPCPLDAAWDDGDKMILLRGDQIWYWHKDDSVTGPFNFHDEYDLNSWVLKPKPKPKKSAS